MHTDANKKSASTHSRWQYYRSQWKRGLVRAYYRLCLDIAYYFASTRAFNPLFLTMPDELIPETLIRFGAKVGHDTTIMSPLYVHNVGKHRSDHFANLAIGSHCHLGPDLFIDFTDRIEIEDQVTISMRVSLITHMNVGQSPLRSKHFPPQNSPIRIRRGAYIGVNATVLKGVEIGECVVVGAGCVVTKDVPPGAVIVSGTSRIIRYLD